MTPDLQQQLRNTLINNHYFQSNSNLRGLFGSDIRLQQWQHSLPEASSPMMRVNYVIADLLNNWNDNNENALYLMLRVIYERESTNYNLMVEVRNSTLNDKIIEYQREITRLQNNYGKSWDDPEYNRRRQSELENMIVVLQNKLKENLPMCVANTTQPTENLDSLIEQLTQLKLKKSSYEEVGVDVPKELEKQIKQLKRRIDALIEDQKDIKRERLETELLTTETRKEKKSRLLKELAELED